jgi:hypothetical protein
MSGVMTYRLNRKWQNSAQPGDMHFRMFWELLNFFNDHAGYSIVSYGEGATEQGTSTPTAWLTWNDPPPMAENAWFVVNADNSSATLNGDQSRQWQVKFQVANSAAYADTSGSDKGLDGSTGVVAVRMSPDGGWVGGATRDFVAVTASGDLRWSSDSAADEDFNLHLAGDDDTIVVVGQVVTGGYTTPNYSYQRAGYLGQLARRNSNHVKPELLVAPYFIDAAAAAAYPICARYNSSTHQFSEASAIPNSFSLAADGTPVEQHMFAGMHRDTTSYDSFWQINSDPEPWGGTTVKIGIPVRQNFEEHNSLLGQLRFFASLSNAISEGNLTGDGTTLSCGYNTAVRAGVGFPWPGNTTVPVF